LIGLGDRAALGVAGSAAISAGAALVVDSWIVGVAVGLGTWLVLFGVDALRTESPDSIEIERVMPGSMVTGTVSRCQWQLRHSASSNLRVAIADSFAPSLNAERRVAAVLTPQDLHVFETELRPERRGRFQVDALTVRVSGPWRLAMKQKDRALSATLKVVPAFLTRREIELRRQRASLLDVGSRSVRAFGGGTEFDQLREYTPDDQFRHIDWAATARTGHSIVRTYRAEEHQIIHVILDNGRLMAATADGITRLEHAMDAVIGLATVADHIGDRVGLMTFDQVVHNVVAPSRGHRHIGRLINAMYDLEPRLGESDYGAMAAEVLARVRKRSMVVVLTDLQPHVVEASLGLALRAIASRHNVVVGAVTSTEVGRIATTEPKTPADAHLLSAVSLAMEARRRAERQLKVYGVKVLDVPAGELGPRLVDDYLLSKSHRV